MTKQDKYRNRYRVPAASARLRQQIAVEAARRIHGALRAAGFGARARLA